MYFICSGGALPVVVLGSIGFHGIGDLAAANGTTVSTKIRTIPDLNLLPYIDSIFVRQDKDNNTQTHRGR